MLKAQESKGKNIIKPSKQTKIKYKKKKKLTVVVIKKH